MAAAVQRMSMTLLRHLLIRRLVAVIIAVSIGAFIGESLMAEVHEGGGTGRAVPSAVANGPQKDAGLSAPAHGDGGATSQHAPPDDGHPTHVCHEAHAHAVALAAANPEASSIQMQRATITVTADLPGSWSSGPSHRPPIG